MTSRHRLSDYKSDVANAMKKTENELSGEYTLMDSDLEGESRK